MPAVDFPDIEASLAELGNMVDVLARDLLAALQDVRDSPDDNRLLRTEIRALWALVEGSCFALRQMALTVHSARPCFSDAEASALRELAYDVDRNGRVTSRPKHLETLGGVKFTLNSFLKAFELPHDIDAEPEGWRALSRALGMRNAVTHPKSVADLAVSDYAHDGETAMDTLATASLWFVRHLKVVLQAALDAHMSTKGSRPVA